MTTRNSFVVVCMGVGWLTQAALPSAWSRDCNGNGVEDTEDIASGVSQDCNENGIPDACEGWPLEFAAGKESLLGGAPKDAASGDLDNDGDLDLVVAQSGALLQVFVNEGNRTLEPGEEFSVEDEIVRVLLSDVGGDGAPDFVAMTENQLLVYPNQGDGTMVGEPLRLPGPEGAVLVDVHAADLDGDGFKDLCSIDSSAAQAILWFNLGSEEAMGFENSVYLDSGGAGPVAVRTGDFDRDGDLDLVVANRESANVSVILNLGGRQLGEAVAYPRGNPALDPRSFSLGDFNGDGFPDVAFTRAVSHAFMFNRGDASFAEPVELKSQSIFSSLRALRAADFDRDGDLDVVTSSSREGVMVRQNDGDGGFTLTRELGFGTPTVMMEAGDFDGDGWVDLALLSANPSALAFVWNDGGKEGTTSGMEVEVLPLDGCSDVRGCRPHGGTLADLDGDGDLDGIGLMTHPSEFHFVTNERGIMVTQPEPYIFGKVGAANGEHGQWVTAGDVDGDGDVDLVSIDNNSHEFWVHYNRGDGSFEPVGRDRRIRVGSAPQHVDLADLDNDGDLDGIASNMGGGSISIVPNEGGVFSSATTEIKTGARTRSTAIGDLDGDGFNDIVTANSSARSVTILLNKGDGTFASSNQSVRLLGNPNGVEIADFDGDGQLDIVAAVGDRRNCAVLLNQGIGIFGTLRFAGPDYYPVEESGVYSVDTGDFDGDGIVDLVTANETAGSVSLLFGNGDGSFGAPTTYSAGVSAGNRMALPGDLDGDGDLDIMTFNRGNHTATVLYNRTPLDDPDYTHTICTVSDFFALASRTSSAKGDGQEFVKFTLPVSDDAALEDVVFQNTSRHRLHQDFLTRVFPESFPALDGATYDNLVGRRESRQYFVGAIRVVRTPKGARYLFDVFARFGDASERLSAEEVASIHEQLEAAFPLGALAYAPTSLEAVEVAREWQNEDVGFPILIEGTTGGYEPYTRGVGYGRVRLLSAEAFEEANATGGISFQDILILERAPRDIEGVVNGIITGERQGELSHLAVRTARRGTPNAFVRSATEAFSAMDGVLVRLEVGETGYTVREASEEEAKAFWEANAGFLSHLPTLDAEYADFASLPAIAALDAEWSEGELPAEARFGGKASNLARLQSILTGEWGRYQIKGFGIPLTYYLEFIRSNVMPSAFEPNREVTYEAYLQELFDSEAFATDSQFRFQALAYLRAHMREFGVVREALVEDLHREIAEVMGTSPETRVRFRSSSNAEDAIEFNGAGLYDSTQGCVADDLDSDSEGPSICNESKKGERGLSRALRRVWSSLWNFRAVEERSFYRIPHELPAMGILVSEAFDGELANGVATTGNATNANDPRFVITVQKDDHSVVSPEPGVLPEKNILEMGADGEVARIIRAVASTLAEPGEFVLSDEELHELGALMWHIHTQFPVELGSYDREDLILEIEFKKRANGEMAVKQVRPFLLSERGPVPPEFALDLAEHTVLCGVFDAPNLGRSIQEEAAWKSELHLYGGRVALPTAVDAFTATLVEKVVFDEGARVAMARDDLPGEFRFEKLPGDEPGLLIYRFEYEQRLAFLDGEEVTVKWALLDFETRDGVVVEPTLTLSEDYLVDELSLQVEFDHGGQTVTNFYGSCGLETIPLWEIRAELADGTEVVLHERFRDEAFGDFQPAALVRGEVGFGDGDLMQQTQANHWKLAYKAARHNEDAEYLVLFDDLVELPGVPAPVQGVLLIAPSHNEAAMGVYLDEDLQEIAATGVSRYEKRSVTAVPMRRLDLDVKVAVETLAVNGVRGAYLVLSFNYRAGEIEPGHEYRVESSADLLNWSEDAVRLKVEALGGGAMRETWRSGVRLEEVPAMFVRVLED